MNEILILLQKNQPLEAFNRLQAMLNKNPADPNLLHLAGVCQIQMHEHQKGIEYLNQALMRHHDPAYLTNRGVAHQSLGQHAKAIHDFKSALSQNTNLYRAWFGLAESQLALKQFQDAMHSLNKCPTGDQKSDYLRILCLEGLAKTDEALEKWSIFLSQWPDFQAGWHSQGNLLYGKKEYPKAILAYQKAIQLNPDHRTMLALANTYMAIQEPELAMPYFEQVLLKERSTLALSGKAECCRRKGQLEECRHLLKEILTCGTDAECREAQYWLNALDGKKDEIPPEVLKSVFDSYAHKFEDHLVKDLLYRVPFLMRDFLQSLPLPAGSELLDLGCGTGLVGKALHGSGVNITGVDLSSDMIQKTLESGFYTKAICQDMVHFLGLEQNIYDCITLADCMIYCGNFEKLLHLIKPRLKAGGFLLLSIELSEDQTYALKSTGRFGHNPDYIQKTLEQHHFSLIKQEKIDLRKENNQFLPGALFFARLDSL